MNVERWRSEFPITERYAYFDHASVGPTPRRSVDAVTGTLHAQSTRGSLEHPALHELAEQARRQYAQTIGAEITQIAHIPNTSAGVSLIARGFDWRRGDEVVVPEIDFPSAVLPWMVLEPQGVVVRRVPCPNGRVGIEDLIAACNARTRMMCASWIQFSSGHRLDLERLGAGCRQRGVFLIVDGAQGVGAIPISVRDLPIDALLTHGYKWLLGPQGVGWLYLSERMAGATRLSAAGVRSMTPRVSFLDHTFAPRADAARFETGILDFHAIAGALESLRLLEEAGASNVESRITELIDRLYAGLIRAGCEVKGGPDRKDFRSGIVAFRQPARDAAATHERLLRTDIVTSVREGCVRVSPHFYNTPAEIDRLLAALPE